MRQTSGQRKRMEIRAVAEAWVCVSSYRVATYTNGSLGTAY